jgi:DDE family transposase
LLKQIVHHSAKFLTFFVLLQLNLSKPQQKHVQRLADAVITCDIPDKTLKGLYRLIVDAPDASNAADCLRIGPWTGNDVREPVSGFVVQDLVALAKGRGERQLFVSVDDSLGEKDKASRHLEPVEYHYDHTKSTPKQPRYTNGLVHIEVRLQIGRYAYSYDHRLYLREKTVRRLNRNRPPEKRLKYRSKYRLVREMLVELNQQLPPGFQVYLLCDSWYTSNKLLKFCRRQGWHVIAAIKSNRQLNGKKLSEWNQQLKHQRYQQLTLPATDPQPRTYLVRTVQGKLKHLPFEVCVFISKRHPGDKRPKYFVCTELSLSAKTGLAFYQKRWSIEVDNFSLKQSLGLADFRLQSVEAVEKGYAIVFLALTYLQWRLNHSEDQDQLNTVAQVIRSHRLEHARQVLQVACQQALHLGQVEPILQRFIHSP